MAEVEAASAAPGEKRSVGRPRKVPAPAAPASLLKASESGDPAVQKLIGDLYTARQNGDQAQADVAVAALEDLGFA